MVKYKHHGKRSKSRYKSKKWKGERTTITKVLAKFKTGEKVHILFDPAFPGGPPYRRFIGKTGTIVGKQGTCYLINIRDQRAQKQVLVHPAHLKTANEE